MKEIGLRGTHVPSALVDPPIICVRFLCCRSKVNDISGVQATDKYDGLTNVSVLEQMGKNEMIMTCFTAKKPLYF